MVENQTARILRFLLIVEKSLNITRHGFLLSCSRMLFFFPERLQVHAVLMYLN